MTMACARCHDHKYDPIASKDYDALYSVFNSCEQPDELPVIGQPPDKPRGTNSSARSRKRQLKKQAFRLESTDDLRKPQRLGEYLVLAQGHIATSRAAPSAARRES